MLLLVGSGGAWLFILLPAYNRNDWVLTPSQKSATVIVVIMFFIGLAFGGLYIWVDKDNPN